MKMNRLFAALMVFVVLNAGAFTLLGFVYGCAGTQVQDTVDRHELLFKAATQYATLKVLEKNSTLAPRIVQLAGTTAQALESGQLIPVDVVEQQIRAEIKWDQLSPEEFVLVDALIASVRLELDRALTERFSSLEPDEAQRQAMFLTAKVLRWIEGAALMKVGA